MMLQPRSALPDLACAPCHRSLVIAGPAYTIRPVLLVDFGLVADWVYSTPNQPPSTDPPRSFPGRVITRHLRNQQRMNIRASKYLCGGSGL